MNQYNNVRSQFPRTLPILRMIATLLVLTLVGCNGLIELSHGSGDVRTNDETPPQETQPPAISPNSESEPEPRDYDGPRPGVQPDVECTSTDPGTRPYRRLTAAQLNGTVRAIFGDVSFSGLPPDAIHEGFRSDALLLDLSSLGTEQLFSSVEEFAKSLQPDNYNFTGCDVTSDACARASVATLARKLFRRAVGEIELDALETVYDLMREDEATPFESLTSATEAALLMPQSLFLVVESDEQGRATAESIAHELSYLLWNEPASADLITRVQALASQEALGELVSEMLGDERAIAFFTQFFEDLFHTTQPLENSNFDIAGGNFAGDARSEMKKFIRHVFSGERKDLSPLLTDDTLFPSGSLSTIYGVSQSAEPISGGSMRTGILSRAAVLTANSGGGERPGVTGRGAFVRMNLLCFEIAPPDNLDIGALPDDPALSSRERLAAHAQGSCASCHTFMDPIGFGFEEYDPIGQIRTHEPGGALVDASGEVTAADLSPTTFYGLAELGAKFADSQLVRDCIALQLFRAMAARPEEDVDMCSIVAMQDSSTDGDLGAMIAAYAGSTAFLRSPMTEEGKP